MSKIFQEILIPKTLEDYCEVREETLNVLKGAYQLRESANNKFKEVYSYGLNYNADFRESLERVTQDIDRTLWRQAFDVTNFSQLMDAKARKEFEQSLEKEPPEFTIENVRSIFVTQAQDAEMMFARGLVNVFLGLCRCELKTNQANAFKVERKVIIGYMVGLSYGGGLEIGRGMYYHGSDKLNDIDRVFKTLDNKIYTPRSLETAMNEAFKKYEVFEDEYYRAKGFKNGNLHLEFKRQDLLEKANQVIAKFYEDGALGNAA